MILTPDDHRSLQVLDGKLAAGEPHLAAMFTIFSRLNAEEPPPPSEDLIVAALPAAPAPPESMKPKRHGGRWRRAQLARSQTPQPRTGQPQTPRPRTERARPAAWRGDRGWKPLAAVAIPVLLLVTVIVVMFVGLASAMKCSPATTSARSGSSTTTLTVPGAAGPAGCVKSPGQAKLAGG
jgi:hypothetical protein